MKLTTVLLACGLGAALSVSVTAQTAMVVGGAANAPLVLRSGTRVTLRTLTQLSTKEKELQNGQRFNVEVVEAVKLNDRVVIPVGSPGVGEITSVRNKGMWGKSGRITAHILYIEANGRQIRVSGQMDSRGETGTAGVVGAIAFVPVAGFFVTGTSAVIPTGSSINAVLDEDVPVAFADAAPAQQQPMPVNAPAPQPAAQVVKISSPPHPQLR